MPCGSSIVSCVFSRLHSLRFQWLAGLVMILVNFGLHQPRAFGAADVVVYSEWKDDVEGKWTDKKKWTRSEPGVETWASVMRGRITIDSGNAWGYKTTVGGGKQPLAILIMQGDQHHVSKLIVGPWKGLAVGE